MIITTIVKIRIMTTTKTTKTTTTTTATTTMTEHHSIRHKLCTGGDYLMGNLGEYGYMHGIEFGFR